MNEQSLSLFRSINTPRGRGYTFAIHIAELYRPFAVHSAEVCINGNRFNRSLFR